MAKQTTHNIQNSKDMIVDSPMNAAKEQQQKNEFNKVWNAEKVAECIRMLEQYGECPGGNPFYESKPEWKKADITYEYSDEELVEITKCAADVVYFGNTYCKAMTDEGIQKITLRPYQENILRNFQNNRFLALMSSRQAGKTLHRLSLITYKTKNNVSVVPIYVLFYSLIKRVRKLTFLEKIKLFLYDLESKLTYNKIYKLEESHA